MSTENDKLDLIATESARRLKSAITEAHADILEAWKRVAEQSVESKKPPVLRLTFAVRLNLRGSSLVTELSLGTRLKFPEAGELPDQNQAELPIAGVTPPGEMGANDESQFRRGGGGISADQAEASVAAIDRAKARNRGGK